VARLRANIDDLALHRRTAAVDAGHDVVVLAVKRGVAVDVGVGTQLFDDVDLNLQAFAVGGCFQVLRAAEPMKPATKTFFGRS